MAATEGSSKSTWKVKMKDKNIVTIKVILFACSFVPSAIIFHFSYLDNLQRCFFLHIQHVYFTYTNEQNCQPLDEAKSRNEIIRKIHDFMPQTSGFYVINLPVAKGIHSRKTRRKLYWFWDGTHSSSHYLHFRNSICFYCSVFGSYWLWEFVVFPFFFSLFMEG